MREFFTDILYEVFANTLYYLGSFIRWIFSDRRESFSQFHSRNEKKWYDIFISVSITVIIGLVIYYCFTMATRI